MKRKELYEFVREGIISELSEVGINEMARIPNKIRVGDAAKITLAKELYGPETIEGRLIAAIEGSEGGLTQKELENLEIGRAHV